MVAATCSATASAPSGAGELALTLGLLTGLVALTTTMAQIERGANRIYGVERDRPALAKYLRAAVLAVVAGVPALAGFLILVGGGAMGDSVQRHYEWGDVADGRLGRGPLAAEPRADRARRGGAVPARAPAQPARPVLALLRRRHRHRAVVAGQPAAGRVRASSAAASARPTAR